MPKTVDSQDLTLISVPKKRTRDRTKELMLAQVRQARRVGDLAVARDDGSLGG